MRLDRRAFLSTAVAGTAGAVAATRMGAAVAAPADPAGLVPLGRLHVPRIGMGTGVRAGNRVSAQTRMGREVFEEVIRYAYDSGVRLFDLADLYGSHEYLARVLGDEPRESYYLVSKLWFRPGGLPEPHRDDADVGVKRFLDELQTDYIDIVQIHCMTDADWTDSMRKQMDLLEKCREEGLIRAHGVSCHSLAALKAAAEDPWVDIVHARINPFGEKMDGPPEEVVPVLEQIHEAGKGVIGMKIIGEGAFSADSEKCEESVRYTLGLGCVDVLIVGFMHNEEIDDFKARVARGLAANAAG